MINIDKQVSYWKNGAREDWDVAEDLVNRGRMRHGLFFLHVALEKALKAHVCRATQNLAPKIHNLIRLAETAGMDLNQEQKDTLAEINAFNVEGRYPESLMPPPSLEEAKHYLLKAKEVFQWLTNRL